MSLPRHSLSPAFTASLQSTCIDKVRPHPPTYSTKPPTHPPTHLLNQTTSERDNIIVAVNTTVTSFSPRAGRLLGEAALCVHGTSKTPTTHTAQASPGGALTEQSVW